MIADGKLRDDIIKELEWEASIDATQIGVIAKDGIVTLTGAVKNFPEKLSAGQATRRVKGVKAVVDEIEIRLPGVAERNDADIAESAINALKYNTIVPKDQIQVTVVKGWVTLDGEVNWQYQRINAENSVRSLLGVKGVFNKINIKPTIQPSDVSAKIQSALVRNAQIDASHIEVTTEGRTVILSGEVRSLAEKEQATFAAWSAPGVANVKNNVIVRT